eukprot:3883398-Amphidinium_carterae.1
MKWVDTDKGDATRPNYRSRLVCREVKKAKRPQLKASELFSSMPPLEAIQTLCSLFMSLGVSPKGKPRCPERLVRRAAARGRAARDRHRADVRSLTKEHVRDAGCIPDMAARLRQALRWQAVEAGRLERSPPLHRPEQLSTVMTFYCSATTTTTTT